MLVLDLSQLHSSILLRFIVSIALAKRAGLAIITVSYNFIHLYKNYKKTRHTQHIHNLINSWYLFLFFSIPFPLFSELAAEPGMYFVYTLFFSDALW